MQAAQQVNLPIRARGGIGRRARLRALCPQGRAGSTPVGPTESRGLRVERRVPESNVQVQCSLALDPRLLALDLLLILRLGTNVPSFFVGKSWPSIGTHLPSSIIR